MDTMTVVGRARSWGSRLLESWGSPAAVSEVGCRRIEQPRGESPSLLSLRDVGLTLVRCLALQAAVAGVPSAGSQPDVGRAQLWTPESSSCALGTIGGALTSAATGTHIPLFLGLSYCLTGADAKGSRRSESCQFDAGGQYPLSDGVRDAVWSNGVAYTVACKAGLQIFSPDGQDLQPLGFFNSTPGLCFTGVDIVGKYAIVVDQNGAGKVRGAVRVIDVSYPAKCRQVGVYDYPITGSETPQSIHAVGEMGIVSYGQAFPQAVDFLSFADSAKPARVGGYVFKQLQELNDFTASGNYLYGVGPSQSGQAVIEVLDVSNPLNPSSIGSLGISGGSTENHLAIRGASLFVSAIKGSWPTTSSFFVVDVSTPSNPVLSGELYVGDAVIRSLAAVDSTVFAVSIGRGARNGVQAIDVSDDASPVEAGWTNCSLIGSAPVAAANGDLVVGSHPVAGVSGAVQGFGYSCT